MYSLASKLSDALGGYPACGPASSSNGGKRFLIMFVGTYSMGGEKTSYRGKPRVLYCASEKLHVRQLRRFNGVDPLG